MAVVVVAINNLTRVNNADARGTLWQDLGGGTAVDEPDFFYQGTQSVSEKVKTTESGIKYFDTGTSHALSTNDRTVIFKHLATNKDALNVRGVNAGILEVGSGDRVNYYRYYVVGSDNYPKNGGWLVTPINPNIVAFRSATVASPNLAAVDFYAWAADFTATSKSENCMMDAIDFVDAGGGLILTGGDSTDPDGVFNDFPEFDEDTIGNAYGLATRIEGVNYIFGTMTIGSATATVFTDTGSVLVFRNGFFNAGFSGLAFGLQSASSVHTLTNETMVSNGVGNRERFNTETGINGSTEVISGLDNSDLREIFPIATAVIAQDQDGTEDATIGLTDGTRYWVGHAATGISLHTTQANAIALTSAVNLTASSAGNGEVWRLDADIDTRAVINVTGTSGALALVGGQYTNFADYVLTAGATLTDMVLVDTGAFTTDGAQIDGCTFLGHTTLEGESFITCSDLDDIFDSTLDNTQTGGRGFGIESTVVANDTLAGVTLLGYEGSTTLTDHEFDGTAGGVDTTNNRITMDSGDVFADGDAVYYTRRLTANTIVTGLTEGTVYYVNRFAAGVYTLHLNEGDALNGNAAINLSVVGSGTQSLYSANAAIFFSGGGTQTLSVSGGTTPTYAAVLDSVITISATVTVTFDKMRDNTEIWVFPAGVTGIGNEIAQIEEATAGSPDDRSFAWSAAPGTNVDYIIHNWDAVAEDYQHFRVEGFVVPSVNVTIDISQVLDRNSI